MDILVGMREDINFPSTGVLGCFYTMPGNRSGITQSSSMRRSKMAPSKQDRWLPNWTARTSPHPLEREIKSGTNLEKDDKKNKQTWMCSQTFKSFCLCTYWVFFIISRFSYVGGLGMKQSWLDEKLKKMRAKKIPGQVKCPKMPEEVEKDEKQKGSVWKRASTKAVSRQTHGRWRRKPDPSKSLQATVLKAKCVPRKWECETAPHLSLMCIY